MELLAVIWLAGLREDAAGVLLALDGQSVLEILPPLPVRPLPGTSPWVRGLTTHRGVSIPVVDASRLLGFAPQAPLACNRVIVAAFPEPHHGHRIGLWVDAVLDVRRVDFAAPEAHPGLEPAGEEGVGEGGARPKLLGPLGPTPWGLAQLLRVRELFDERGWHELVGRLVEAAA